MSYLSNFRTSVRKNEYPYREIRRVFGRSFILVWVNANHFPPYDDRHPALWRLVHRFMTTDGAICVYTRTRFESRKACDTAKTFRTQWPGLQDTRTMRQTRWQQKFGARINLPVSPYPMSDSNCKLLRIDFGLGNAKKTHNMCVQTAEITRTVAESQHNLYTRR